MPIASAPLVKPTSQQQRWAGLKRVTAVVMGAVTIAISLLPPPAIAGDPFRASDSRNIDSQTEAAFKAIFEQGNYREAAQLLDTAQTDEPLAYAMKASIAYLNGDNEGLGRNGTLTREAAQRLTQSDPLRGHIYTAAGHFLEGAHTLTTQGTVRATPAVLGKLQQVFNELGEAEKIAPNDPELNLIKGFMDLMLAVNLPFSNPQQAIERLQNYAAPDYLAQRGIAIGYRDLEQPDLALQAVERAIQAAPNNPDLLYLKAQILVLQNRPQESLRLFRQALAQREQLPDGLGDQIAYEQCRANNRVNNRRQNCNRLLQD
ncbi:Sll0314/Alr1548 family TPR repeat-containing protein [Oculatella sp. LEGE 06141]|uniref:Sll0314/Alr1548 family TPR repeat-containing protein n=1 Tax=Oculatella sp. LEGE 06141 TaxID=1828648 RepID=UPI001D132CF9|nr:Sll0314/Alr1548 family TPR repeat-containing protein [Oculatella sp. LEGE 06141]